MQRSFIGNLGIEGVGDPSLAGLLSKQKKQKDCLQVLKQWALAVQQLGIQRIQGDLVIDVSRWGRTTLGAGWFWDDLQYGYSAPASGVSVNHNQLDITVEPAQVVGGPAKVSVYPRNSFYRLVSAVKTTQQPGSITVAVNERSREIHVNGSIGLKQQIIYEDAAIKHPELFFASVFRELLRERGVRVDGTIRVVHAHGPNNSLGDRVIVASHQSPPLRDIVRFTLAQSNNFVAELLFRAPLTVSGASTEDMLKGFLRRASIDPQSLRIADGSGLSRLTVVSPAAEIAVLQYMYQKYGFDFINTLPRVGLEGTVAHRLSEAKAQIVAKTGGMTGVRSLLGCVSVTDEKPWFFTIVANNYTCGSNEINQAIDAIVAAIDKAYCRKSAEQIISVKDNNNVAGLKRTG